MSDTIDWPPLPTSGFISGRAANVSDAEDGNAVFVAMVDDEVVGVPLEIEIPQYGYLVDGESGERTRVVIVQAEHAGGTDMIGYREIGSDVEGAGTLPEFELLGARPPG